MRSTKLIAVFAMLATAGLLAACSGGTNAGKAGSGSSQSNVLTLASVDQGSIEDVVKAFEKANPGVDVRFTTSGADQYQQQIR
ncbi:MAG TPA: hypothetical protein VG497_34520, partial [Kribbella sp.]|nr:hypothetical protein [Kribbella sp.]